MNSPVVLSAHRFCEREKLFSKWEVWVIQRGPNGLFLHRGCNWFVDNLKLAAKASKRGLMIVTLIVTVSPVIANTIYLVVHYRLVEIQMMYNSVFIGCWVAKTISILNRKNFIHDVTLC